MDENGGDVRRVGDVGGAVANDGQKITFAKVVGGRSGVFVRDLATGAERELAGGDKPQE
jgi:hypothetical protein